MTAVHVTDAPAGSPEWHAARAKGLGGSEIAAVVGLSPFESRFGLFHRKHGDLGPVEETPEMYWGKVFEPIIRNEFENRNDWYVRPTPGLYRHPDREWHIANTDALLYEDFGRGLDHPDAVLECKLSMFGDGWGDDGTDQVPPHVRCQGIWYCDVFRTEAAHVAVLIASGLDFRTYEIRYDPEEAEQLRTAGALFLEQIAQGIRPDIDDHGATYQAIKELHPDIDGQIVEVDGGLACRFARARRVLGAAKAAEQQVRSELADTMGEAKKAVWDGHTIATRQTRNDGIPYLVAGRNLHDIDTELVDDSVNPAVVGTDEWEPF